MRSPREHGQRLHGASGPADGPAVGVWLRGKYHLDRVLGTGGMATVYAATHRNKKKVAIKILRTEVSSLDVIRRFVREGYVANTVEHPGVVSVLDDDVSEGGHPFLVMELLEGESVESAVLRRGGRLEADEVLSIAHQMLDVLAAAHARSVVHRDIKPGNLFITTSGQLKVLDFGIARLREEHGNASETSTGRTLGTPAFMAPEQARGKTSLIGPPTDIWGVGATMFSLLAGQTVHEGETLQELVFNTAAAPARSLASLVGSAPPELIALVDRALAFEPGDRWASAAAMRDEVARVHQTMFGIGIGYEPLERLVLNGRVVVPASDPLLHVDQEPESHAATLMAAEAPSSARTMVALSSTHASGGEAAPSRRARPALLVLASVVFGLVVAAAVLVGARARQPAEAKAAAPAASAEGVPAAASIASPSSVASTSAPVAAGTTATVAPASAPVVSAAARAPVRLPTTTSKPRPAGATPKNGNVAPPGKTTSDWDRQ